MKTAHYFPLRSKLAYATLICVGLAATASAQFTGFRSTAIPTQIYTMATNGSASVYNLSVSVATNGIISGSGKRFDVVATAFNASPIGGATVSLSRAGSKLGLPVVVQTNRSTYYDPEAKRNLTHTTIKRSAAANILLSDATRFKGVITKSRDIYQWWDASAKKVVTQTNHQVYTSITGGATRSGRFGFGNGYQ